MRTWKIIVVGAAIIAAIVIGGGALLQWFHSDAGDEWIYTSPDHGFTIRIPSSSWKEIKKPGAAVAFYNSKYAAQVVINAEKETREEFERISAPGIKHYLDRQRGEFLAEPFFKNGTAATGNPYAYWKGKAKTEGGGAVFVAHSVVWCKNKELTVRVLMEGQLKMVSQAGSSAEWEYFEKAADLFCLSVN